MNSIIPLGPNYVLRIRSEASGMSGEIIMLSAAGQAETHLFDAPLQESSEALVAWSRRALQAYREG